MENEGRFFKFWKRIAIDGNIFKRYTSILRIFVHCIHFKRSLPKVYAFTAWLRGQTVVFHKVAATSLFFPTIFLKKIFGGHEPFLWGHWYPLFWTSGDISSGLQSQSGQPYLSLVEVYMLHIPSDSPLVQHLLTSWQSAWQLSHLFHIPARHWWDSKLGAIMPLLTVWDQADQTIYWLSYPGSASQLLYN